jgi:hypothetical protein
MRMLLVAGVLMVALLFAILSSVNADGPRWSSPIASQPQATENPV